MGIFEILMEQNILLPFLVIILIILISIYIYMYIHIKIEKKKMNEYKAEDSLILPQKRGMYELKIVDNIEENRTKVIYVPKDIKKLKKESTTIKGLLKNAVEIVDEQKNDTPNIKELNINYKVYKKRLPDEEVELKDNYKSDTKINEEEMVLPKVKKVKEKSYEDIAFSKEIIPVKSINERIVVPDDEPKFEKTEMIDLEELYKLMEKDEIKIKDDTKKK